MRIGTLPTLAFALVLGQATAAPLIYKLTGSLQATYPGGSANGCFTVSVNADTAAITNPSAGKFQVAATSSVLTVGSQTTALTGMSVYLNTSTGQVTFGSTANAGGGIGFTNDALKTWNFASSIGPFNGADFLQQGTGTLTLVAVDSSGAQTVVTLTGTSTTGGVGCSSPATFQAAVPAPIISSIANAASNVPFNSPIAQGAIFVIKGSGLGPSTLSISPTPFQTTTVSGTSVAFTAGTTTVNALMYYTSDGQIAALLPSNAPVGGGSFTVTYNGQTSAPVTHGTAPSNVGIFTVDSTGGGPGIVTYADYSLVSAAKSTPCGGPNTTCGAANPGDTLILWATGLGPVGDDASGAGLGQNMPNVPLTVLVGGAQATVLYQGRSGCCIGEDQIVFTVPNSAPIGCAVPLVVQIGTTTNTVSNTTTIPISRGSRDCTPVDPFLASASLPTSGLLNIGQIDLVKAPNPAGNGLVDEAAVGFFSASIKPGSTPFFASYLDTTPQGQCTVTPVLDAGDNVPATILFALDAGASLTLKGPSGSVPVSTNSGGSAIISASGSFLTPGTFTISGPGGKDVGPFSASVTVPSNPTLTAPAGTTILSVTRSSGLTFAWKGGDPGTNVQIIINSALDGTFTTGSTAKCIAPTAAGEFTVPGYVLLALPGGTFANYLFGAARTETAFTATGVNFGLIRTQSMVASGALSLK